MHTHQVLHHNLKLGNLFLDLNMNVKVVDIGLAALIENPGERKKPFAARQVIWLQKFFLILPMETVLRWSIGVIYRLQTGR